MDPPFEPGHRAGSYVLVRKLADSGSGEVWEARDHDGAPFAVKIFVSAIDEPARVRLIAQTRALSKLMHPNLTRIHELTMFGSNRLAIVMELLDGVDLWHCMREGRLPIPEALLIAAPISAALATVHAANLSHRSLTPYAIQLVAGHVPKLIGFDTGALSYGGDEPAVVGNPRYLAPEQITTSPYGGDHRADIYSLAMIVFELCAGRPPHDADNVLDMVMAKLGPPPRLRELVPETPRSLDDQLAAMMDPDPERRPPIDTLHALVG
jgi:eukaryotic-like serine/threonine-protein kinase